MGHAVLVLAAMVLLMAAPCRCEVEQCPPYDDMEKIVYLPHPHDCSLFRRCQAGNPVLGRCPPGQHFSPASMACGDPMTAGCTAKPESCTAGGPQYTCRFQCACPRRDNKATCPARLEFPTQLHVFNWPNATSCTRGPEDIILASKKLGQVVVSNTTAKVSLCPGGRYPRGSLDIPHFADCTKVVRCTGASVAVLQCPKGMVYDADLGYCEDPVNVDCGVVPAPPGGCPTAEPLSSCDYLCECHVLSGKCPPRLNFTTRINITDTDTHPDCLTDPALISIEDHYMGSVEVDPNTVTLNPCPVSRQGETTYVTDTLECGKLFQCKEGHPKQKYNLKGMQFDPLRVLCTKNLPPCEDPQPSAAPPVVPDRTVAVQQPCPISGMCPTGNGTRLPHLTDCTLFCECVQGTPLLGACPPGLYFNQQAQSCDSPQNAGCQTFCKVLPVVPNGHWDQAQCDFGNSPEGTVCSLQCDSTYLLTGSDTMNCTSRGWYGSGGLNMLPSCNNITTAAKAIMNKINATMTAVKNLGQKAKMLFVLDESVSVQAHNFEIEKNFVEALVSAFPLSANRTAGVITFSGLGDVAVDISLRQSSTCDFLGELAAITYSGGATDLEGALVLAKHKIDLSRTTGQPSVFLVFVITDGRSYYDPMKAAAQLRDNGHIVFTIGVAGYDRKQLEPLSSTHKDGSKLFFALPNFQVFKVVANYLRSTYQNNSTLICPERLLKRRLH